MSKVISVDRLSEEINYLKNKVKELESRLDAPPPIQEEVIVENVVGLDLGNPKKTYIFILGFRAEASSSEKLYAVKTFREKLMSVKKCKANIIVALETEITVVE